jgi:preprotein translocase subunit Sss1
MGMFFVGAIGFIICLIILVVKAVRKKPKKIIGILTGLFLIIGIVGMISAMNTPSLETVTADYDKIMNGEMNGQLVDLVGDIEDIKQDGELYRLTIKTSDGVYQAVTTKNVSGTFPRVGDKRVKMYVTPEYSESNQLVITIISFRK